MKKVILMSVIVLLAVFAVIGIGQTKIKAYYSGDAVSFDNQIYVASTNSDSLEVLKLQGNQLTQLAKLKPFDGRLGKYGRFYDVKFSVENNQLFVYAVTDFTLYKYQLVNDQLQLNKQQKNTYWEWYTRVDKFGDNVVTISDKGISVWSNDFQIINNYAVSNSKNPYNVTASNGRFILNTQNNQLSVYDRENRQVITNISLNYKDGQGNRHAYQDSANNIYAIDDSYVKKFDLNGDLLASFKHLDYNGYDVAASGYNNYIYFSNGLGVVKLDKNTLKEVDTVNTTTLGGQQGWAMGLKVINANGDKIVVFNNANILVLNDQLKKIASHEATDEETPTPTENLYLNLNHNLGAPGATVNLTGGGFMPNESLIISFGGVKTSAIADDRGRLDETLVVPSLPAGRVDIKVDGVSSQLTYSIDFNVSR